MQSLVELRLGPFHALSAVIVSGLIVTDALWTLRIHRHALSQKSDRPPGYSLGLAVAVWSRSLVVAIAGVLTLFGSMIAFALFACGVVWRALGPGRDAVSGFLAGYEDATGTTHPGLAAAFGAGYVGITRGIPLLLLYTFMSAA